MQRAFSLGGLVAGLALAFLVVAAHRSFIRLPNRVELGPRSSELRLRPVRFEVPQGADYRIAMAFRVSADDRRFGAVSGLAIDGADLLAVSDSGVAMRFAKPRPTTRRLEVAIRELPAGPGPAGFKSRRDSEAIVRDPGGRGWWVAFEQRDQVWLYDRQFASALGRIAVRGQDWHYNRGVEGLVAESGGLWLFPEEGGEAIEVGGAGTRAFPLTGIGGGFPWDGWVAEAAMLPGGRLLLAERKLLPTGFKNRLAIADIVGSRIIVRRRYRLALGRFDNVEALAVEPLTASRTRLWVMTDNDHRPFPETLVLAIDLPAEPRR